MVQKSVPLPLHPLHLAPLIFSVFCSKLQLVAVAPPRVAAPYFPHGPSLPASPPFRYTVTAACKPFALVSAPPFCAATWHNIRFCTASRRKYRTFDSLLCSSALQIEPKRSERHWNEQQRRYHAQNASRGSRCARVSHQFFKKLACAIFNRDSFSLLCPTSVPPGIMYTSSFQERQLYCFDAPAARSLPVHRGWGECTAPEHWEIFDGALIHEQVRGAFCDIQVLLAYYVLRCLIANRAVRTWLVASEADITAGAARVMDENGNIIDPSTTIDVPILLRVKHSLENFRR